MGAFSITAIDVVVVIVVLVSAVFAMARGIIQETFTIFEWIAGGIVALRFAPTFQPLLRDAISPPWLAMIVAFVGIFLIVFIPLSILAHRLSEMVKKSEIGPVDRVLGLLFGLGRGFIIVGGAYLVYSSLVPMKEQSASVTKAALFPLIQQAGDVVLGILPLAHGQAAGFAVSSPSREAKTQSSKPSGAASGKTDAAAKKAQSTKKVEASAKPGENPGKTYGEGERRALNNLIEATGGGTSSR